MPAPDQPAPGPPDAPGPGAGGDPPVATPSIVVLFGATGDLSRRMVLPALFELSRLGLVPRVAVIGNGRGDVSDDQFRAEVRQACEQAADGDLDQEAWARFAPRLRFAGHGFSVEDPGQLPRVLDEVTRDLGGQAQRLLYLAVPPQRFEPLTRAFAAHELAHGSRVVFEKPFGTSCASFRRLDAAAHEVLEEDQIFRIDHFLGKEATHDLHVVRFANGLFSRVWDRHHIASVQIDVPERLDVANRGSFYDHTGAVLDMIVTHLVQLLAEVAMEPPFCLEPDDVAAARTEVLDHLRPVRPDDVVLGQYEGYQDTVGVAEGSTTETYAALRVEVDADRWQGVPFVLRTGKAMARSAQRVTVAFRSPERTCGFDPGLNALTFDLGGQGSVGLRMLAREPSASSQTTVVPVAVELPLGSIADQQPLPAYVGLLYDALRGDRSRFTRPDGLASVWSAFEPVLEARPDPIGYAPGSWGPRQADVLVGSQGWAID
jgi:glucose-6-phosphate 1-dehydrogenase